MLHKLRLYVLHRHSALDAPADARPYSLKYVTHVCRHPRAKARHNPYIEFVQHPLKKGEQA